jgi:hypothetical protein
MLAVHNIQYGALMNSSTLEVAGSSPKAGHPPDSDSECIVTHGIALR